MGEERKKVILVDDEKAVVESISQIVDWESEGFALAAACLNGFQALDAIRKHQPDIVITDIKMPVMDGIELIKKTREFDRQVTFIILSGYGEFELAKRAMKEGVREFLLKPCSEGEIIEALLNSLKVRDSQGTGNEEMAGSREWEEAGGQDGSRWLGESQDFVELMLGYVEEHYFEEGLNLKWIAKELVFLNEDYVGKCFRRRTGSRFTAYLNEVRIRKAKEYLGRHHEASNEQIAVKVGFGNNPKYFEKVFKKYAGCTPKEYKKTKK